MRTLFDEPGFEEAFQAALLEITRECEIAGLFDHHVITGNDLNFRITPTHLLPEIQDPTEEDWEIYWARY